MCVHLKQLVGEYIEEFCVNPTFLIDYPLVTSPLAKWYVISGYGVYQIYWIFVRLGIVTIPV